MKTDRRIQSDVMEELKWEPFLNASSIGVAVNNGIVTLSGQVDSYAKKVLAERAARRVAGVRAIAEEIKVGISPAYHKSDAEIAEAILNALKWHAAIQEDRIAIKVENGNVRLEGEVESEYERGSAQSTIENLTGVKSVRNLVTVRPKLQAPDIQQKINEAFMRSATIDAGKISAEVIGGKVVLHGKVRSFAEKDDAELAARNAPGVTSVESKLEIETPEYELEV